MEVKGLSKPIIRQIPAKESVDERVNHFNEFLQPFESSLSQEQSGRCMDCGVPFCHNGCPLGNRIPEFNAAVAEGNWREAYDVLISTNNFPEFTGRICPAPCEASCVLNIHSDPVAIEFVEYSIIDHAFKQGWVKAEKKVKQNSIRLAIIGSGPAGLACSDQLNKMGYSVDLYERSDRIGGLLRYGIPDFKLEKSVLDRRIELMKDSGVNMFTSVNVGQDISVKELQQKYDAIILTTGSTVARDLPIKGRDLKGIHLAMEYLEENNRKLAGDTFGEGETIDVKDQHVLVIGGGDTGADCVGTSNRLGAASVTQIELLSKPPSVRAEDDLWPNWPMVLRTSSSHEEGCEREWAILTKRFYSRDGIHLAGVELVDVEWAKSENGKYEMREISNSQRTLLCDKVFLSIGFLYPEKKGLLKELALELDSRGHVMSRDFRTSVPGVYTAGDMRRGQSLVVWAIAEGRKVADIVDRDLKKNSKWFY